MTKFVLHLEEREICLAHCVVSNLSRCTDNAFGSQPNIANNTSPSTNHKSTTKLTKTQSFKHQKTEGLSTPSFLRKFSFKKQKESTSKMFKKSSPKPERIIENRIADFNRNKDYIQANSRDVTSAIVDARGGILVNEYWGVTLEVPMNAIPEGVKQELYFVITDPRTCQNAPPLDLENGIYQFNYI